MNRGHSVEAHNANNFVMISDSEFRKFADLIYAKVGIHLTDVKKVLVMVRLQKIIKKRGIKSFRDYYDFVLKDPSGEALSELVTQISTNYTYFNREQGHFDFFLQKALPAICKQQLDQGTRKIRVWSAGCSTGEEPYMLAMLMREYLKDNYKNWDAGVLATDISDRVLDQAISGVYELESVSKLSHEYIKKYFVKHNEMECVVHPAIKNEVTFRKFNLMNEVFPFKDKFDVIFCRNVMIYFDGVTRFALVERFSKQLKKNGYFFIGHSETIGRDHNDLQYIMPALYVKV